MSTDSAELFRYVIAAVCILVGLILLLLIWELINIRKGLQKILLGLAEHGPCSGLELRRKTSYGSGAMYYVLDQAIEQGYVAIRYRMNSPTMAVIRGELRTREFRLTAKGQQVVAVLKGGGELDEKS